MRLLYLSAPGDVTEKGGVQRYTREVGAAMAARGHEVRWVHAGDDVLSHMRLLDRIPRPWYWDSFYFRRGTPIQDYRFHQILARQVAAACASFAPDLVHSFFVYNLSALSAPRPVSVTCHGMEVLDIHPVQRMLRGASAIHAVSRHTASVVTRMGKRWLRQAPTVLSWGIVKQEMGPAEARTVDLLTVGRLVHRKNVDTVLRALAHRPAVRYVVVGDGPERAALEDLARSLRLSNVEFVGAVPDEALHRLYRQARVLAMVPRATPEDFEGLGLVYYEAHGHGLPVIAARTGGVPDAVGDAGILVDAPDDAEAVGRAIDEALEPVRFEQLTARVAARQHTHSWDAFIDAFERWHLDVAATRAGRPLRPRAG